MFYFRAMGIKKLPIGVQSFRQLKEGGYLYVDKTELIHKLATEGSSYFLSRPRRFGKSLLISTLKELFSGAQSLFADTWVAERWDWSTTHPVIHLSFDAIAQRDLPLDEAIKIALKEVAGRFGVVLRQESVGLLFHELIVAVSGRYGKPVILIDEYDKPIIEYLEESEINRAEANQLILRQFYSVLKNLGEEIRLLFVTGVSKFAKVSIFSDLNHLNDISLNPEYATLVGYTQQELEDNFEDYIQRGITSFGFERTYFLEQAREWYNGFSWDGKQKLYNPFGILNFFANNDFRNYWFSSGTPTFLWEQMKKFDKFDLENLSTNTRLLEKADLRNITLESLLFQTGYLTIKTKDFFTGDVELDYPNKEVRDSFYAFLLDRIASPRKAPDAGAAVKTLSAAFESGLLDEVREIIDAMLADLPYDVFDKKTESLYHGLIHILFNYLGMRVKSEVHTKRGRLDAVVETAAAVYIFEFKFNQTPEAVLAQIKSRNYAQTYRAGGKKITAVGVNFDTDERGVTGWLEEDI